MATSVTEPARNLQQRASLGSSPSGNDEVSGISLHDLIGLINSGKWLIVGLALFGLALGWLVGFLSTPQYQADGLVQVEDLSGAGGTGSSALQQIQQLLSVGTVKTEAELQILQSRMVMRSVVDRMNLTVFAGPRYFPLVGQAIARHNGTATLAHPLFGLKQYAWGGESIVVKSFSVTPALLGQGFVLEAQGNDSYTLSRISDGARVLNGTVGTPAKAADDSVELQISELRARRGTQFYVKRFPLEASLAYLNKLITVTEPQSASGVFQISVVGQTAQFAADVVNAIQAAYLEQNVQRRSEDAQRSIDFLQAQIPETKAKLDAAQLRLMNYQRSHGTVDIKGETESIISQSVQLETQRLNLQQQRELLLQRFMPDHPTVVALDNQIAVIDRQRNAVNAEMQKLPTTQQELASLMRDVGVDNDLYSLMLTTYQGLSVARAATIGNVRIIDPALVPLYAFKPKRLLITLISGFAGMGFGFGFVLVRRALLRGVDDPGEIESKLGLTTYAIVPYSPGQRQLRQRMARNETGSLILAEESPKDLSIEALRSLRTSLHFALIDAPNNILMFTGPTPGVGKSFVSMNFAVVLAMSGKRVVVIDADLRRGTVHTYFRLPASPGVSEHIAGDMDAERIILSTPIENMFVVTRGTAPPNPAELLLNDRFPQFMSALSKRFDYVLIDAPPVLPVADAQIAGRVAGSTLLVLKSGEHQLREIQETYKRLNLSGISLRGIVFNQVGKLAGSYGYGGYGYAYYQYYRYGE